MTTSTTRIATENNEYDFSRFRTYQQCPRKHNYIYREGIRSDGKVNQYTTPGSMFHRCVELIRTEPKDYLKELSAIYKEFNDLCCKGLLLFEPGLLAYVVQQYFEYYRDDHAKESLVMCEYTFKDPIEDGTEDIVKGTIDQVYERDGVIVLRDIKTTQNKLKYTYDDVKNNQQLLFYVPFAEAVLHLTIDAVEIDEVRIARLNPVPLLANGKPSKDKRALELVLQSDYEEELRAQGLFGDASYNSVLEWMTERGHPLFRRIQAQVLDQAVVSENMGDMCNTYDLIKADKGSYRNRSPLCNYCSYKDLCELDMHNPDDTSREIYIENILKNS